jgi:hypothetical protein
MGPMTLQPVSLATSAALSSTDGSGSRGGFAAFKITALTRRFL